MLSRARRWAILFGCGLVSIGVNAYFLAPASIIPLLVDAYDVGRVAASAGISVAILGSVLVQLPSGLLFDRYDNRRLMLPGMAVFALAVVAGISTAYYPAVLVARFVAGLAGGFVYTMGANVAAQVFPPESQGLATGLFVTSGPIGFALAQSTGPVIAGTLSLEAVFLFQLSVAVVGLFLFRAAANEPITSEGRPSVPAFVRALGNRRVILLSLSAFCTNALYLFLNSWMPTYANEVLSISLAEAGAVTALVPLVGVAARPSGGMVSDRLDRRRAVIAASLLFTLLLFLVLPRTTDATNYGALLLLAGFTVQLSVGVYYVFAKELADQGLEGTSLTVLVMISFTGSLSAPIAGGLLVESLSWGATFWVFAAVGLVGIGFLAALPGQ